MAKCKRRKRDAKERAAIKSTVENEKAPPFPIFGVIPKREFTRYVGEVQKNL